MGGEPRISVCGVVEYPCNGECGDWIREHEAVWVMGDGSVRVSGGDPYCPSCAPSARALTTALAS